MTDSFDHFRDQGWMRVAGGLSDEGSKAMREALWARMAEDGIYPHKPETWTVERPTHLQRLRQEPAFKWKPTEALQRAIEAIVGSGFDEPEDWGSAFIAFPSRSVWSVPHKGWHIDANYRSSLFPARGVKTLALLARVPPRGGGTQVLSGSHRLVHRWFREHRPPADARSAELRGLLRAHPYIDSLLSPGDREERIAHFMRSSKHAEGVTLQVVELTGLAGDVILMHLLLMHTAAPNNSAEPRLMISGGVTTDMWGWDGLGA